LMPEMNAGQFSKVVRDRYMVDAIGLNKIQGMPFTSEEIRSKIVELCK
jgi:2-oxoglutarate ferredoxin oxidoreductase subunit alpha